MLETQARYVLKSVSRALETLKVFSLEQPELNLMEISQRLNLNPSTVFRLLATLKAKDFVEQNKDTRKYRLGVACLELGSVCLNQGDIRREAMPILQRLRDDTKETVHLARLAGSDVVYLEKVDGLLPVGVMGSRVGGRAPAHCTGLGKAMLAYQPESEIRKLYGESNLHRFTCNTITKLGKFLDELACVRERSYAIDNEEHELDVECVAVPIWDYQGVVAAISVAGPVQRVNRAITEQGLISTVREAGRAISSHLGGRVHLMNCE